jgi:Cu2+-exporting ATPase
MAIFSTIIAGSVIYTGLKYTEKLLNEKHSKEDKESENQNLTPVNPILSLIKKTDRAYQNFVKRRIDPLLSGSRRQKQLEDLRDDSQATAEPNEQTKTINRQIGISGITMGFAATSHFFPPLIIPTTALAIYTILPLYKRTISSLTKEKKVKLDLLASLYMTGFYLAGYHIFACFAFMLYFLGHKVVYHMEGLSQENIVNLFGQQPRMVWLFVQGVEIETPIHQLKEGDVVAVKAGEPNPVDGIIVDGFGMIDQHMLTGESQPVEKEPGKNVFALTLLLSGKLYIQVEKTGHDTLSAQITQILQQTSKHNSEIALKGQRLADQTAFPNLIVSVIALPVVGFRGAVATLGNGLGANARIVSLLATMNYLSIASEQYILIKDGRAMETLKDVDTIVFDKTGTLTIDQPHVARIHVINSALSENNILIFAAAAEYRQPHPIARAIINAAEEKKLHLPDIDDASYEVGYGIKVTINNCLVRVGSTRFMINEGLTIPARLDNLQNNCQAQGHTLISVAVDNNVAGALELHATVRPEAKQVIQDLKEKNIRLCVISGDHEEPTQKLSKELGIESYYANTLPEEKSNIIQQLQNEGRVVCFIGDGINDAIALKKADVSMSLRGATTIATDTAQIVFMNQNLSNLSYLLNLAHKYDKTLRQGFITTIVPGAICIGGVFLAGFGVIAAEILFQVGFYSGLGVAMYPLLTEKNNRKTKTEEKKHQRKE